MKVQGLTNTIANQYSLTMDRSNQVYQVEKFRLNSSQEKDYLANPQQFICQFFLSKVRKHSPEEMLKEFKTLFVDRASASQSEVHKALYEIVALQQEETFRETLKRCCYILINNWSTQRQYQYIQQLVELFESQPENKKCVSLHKKRLQQWLDNFCQLQDYQDLKVFTAKFNKKEKKTWSDRYASYLLASQYTDDKKSPEQKEAAMLVSHQLKEQFKMELAMYTAHANSKTAREKNRENPTALGDKVLELLQRLLVKRNSFSHENLANIFLKQTHRTRYQEFKKSLVKYLTFAFAGKDWTRDLKRELNKYVRTLYPEHNQEVLDESLLLRTCNRLVDYFTTQSKGEPSSQFTQLSDGQKFIPLAIILLRIVLICKQSYVHLESRLAYLIQYHQKTEGSNCEELVAFLEVLTITLTIYAENVRYNLLMMAASRNKQNDNGSLRVFSQVQC